MLHRGMSHDFYKKTYGLSESFTVGQLSAVKVWGDFVKDY